MSIDEIERILTGVANGRTPDAHGLRVLRTALALLPLVRVAERVVSRGIHRRQGHRDVMLRNVELLPNDIEILTELANAIDTARSAMGDNSGSL